MTDTDMIAKAEALASMEWPGIAVTVEWETARDRHLIALTRADEREACVGVADASAKNDRADYSRCVDSIMRQQFIWRFQSAERIAAAIRARNGL